MKNFFKFSVCLVVMSGFALTMSAVPATVYAEAKQGTVIDSPEPAEKGTVPNWGTDVDIEPGEHPEEGSGTTEVESPEPAEDDNAPIVNWKWKLDVDVQPGEHSEMGSGTTEIDSPKVD